MSINHINFQKIKIKNFLSIGNYFITVNLNANPLTLIYGKNGHGKSLILDAISFALFNKPYRDINKPQLINSINKKDMLVSIEFTIGNDQYKINRGMKPNIFEIFKNDILINQEADNRDYQKYLEDYVIKLNQKGFNQTVIMGSATFVPFMKLKTPERRLVIEELLDLQIFTSMNAVIKQKIKDNEKDIEDVDSNISVIKNNINIQKQFIEQINSNKDEEISDLENLNQQYKDKINSILLEIENNNSEVEELSKKISDKSKVEKNIEKCKEIKVWLSSSKKDTEKNINFFEGVDDTCPTCSQTIDGQFKGDKVNELKNKLYEIEDAMSTLNNKMAGLNGRVSEINNFSNKIQKFVTKHKTLNSEVNHIKTIIKQNKEKIKKLQQKTENTINEYKIEELQLKLFELQETKIKLLEERELYDISLSLLKDTGIKAQIIKTYIPVINKLINRYMKDMGYLINFELDENFNEIIKSPNKEVFTYNSFSEGQKMRINSALIFTWRMIAKMRSSTTTNIIFFDEITDSSLDKEGVECFFRLLKTFEDNTNIFVISHNIDQDRFNNKIKVTMTKNFSKWTMEKN
jgi:DNA repair exonuclease SbcCD ATPase subunit